MTVTGFGSSHDDGRRYEGDPLPSPTPTPATEPGLPEIVYDEGAIDSWREHLLAHLGHNVQLTFSDGRVRDAELRDVRWHLVDGMIGILVAYWVDDKQPDEHAPTEPVSSLDLIRIRIY